MSKQDAEAFVRKVMEDDELRDELDDKLGFVDEDQEDPSKEEIRSRLADVVPEVASAHGFEFTAEDGFEALETIKKKMESDELSDVELEQVAGGKSGAEKGQIAASAVTVGFGCAFLSIRDAAVGEEGCMDY